MYDFESFLSLTIFSTLSFLMFSDCPFGIWNNKNTLFNKDIQIETQLKCKEISSNELNMIQND